MDDLNVSAHRDRILDQFSLEAQALAELPEPASDAGVELLLRATEVAADDSVLDVACGSGSLVFALAARANLAMGVDITPAMIERARARHREATITNIGFEVADAGSLPFRDCEFSLVTCRYALHHALDPAAQVHEMVRVCRPGGRIALVDVITTRANSAAFNAFEKLRDPSHVRALSLQELLAMAQDNGLIGVRSWFYQLEIELNVLLRVSFPKACSRELLKSLLLEDIDQPISPLSVSRIGTGCVVSYPIAVVVGRVPG